MMVAMVMLWTGLGFGLLVLIAVVAIPVLVLWLQVLAAVLFRTRSQPAPDEVRRPSIAVLIPAHNEALVIQATLGRLLPQLQSGDLLLVVADNCDDATADIARAAGAQVVERHNDTLRGKGYALDHGVRHLAALPFGPPEVVVIVDADCDVSPGALDTVVRCCQRTGRPAQALYLMELPASSGSVSPIAALAWRVKNLVRPLGMHHLGLPCHLMGSGMAFPWRLLHDLPLASGHIVEDMQMGVDLARRGAPPVFCPQALVTSTFPVSKQGAQSQRTRWEHGHIGMIMSEVPRMLRDAWRPGATGLVPLALDLAVPPQSLLLMLVLATVMLSALWSVFGFGWLPLQLSTGVLLLFAACLIVSWGKFARDVVSLRAMLRLPVYVLSKVPVYLGFVLRRQRAWVRSSRERD